MQHLHNPISYSMHCIWRLISVKFHLYLKNIKYTYYIIRCINQLPGCVGPCGNTLLVGVFSKKVMLFDMRTNVCIIKISILFV